jgi:hypothetical protein
MIRIRYILIRIRIHGSEPLDYKYMLYITYSLTQQCSQQVLRTSFHFSSVEFNMGRAFLNKKSCRKVEP